HWPSNRAVHQRSVRSSALNSPAPPLAKSARAISGRYGHRYSGRNRETHRRASQENSGRTVCYHFATQLGSTGRNSVHQAGCSTRKNLSKTALRATARHRTKQHGLKLQFSPARHDLGAQAQNAAELLGRGHGLLRGLAVDVEHPRESEDKAGTLLRRHVSFPQSADSKAANSWASRAEPGEPRRAPDMQVAQRGPLLDGSLAT